MGIKDTLRLDDKKKPILVVTDSDKALWKDIKSLLHEARYHIYAQRRQRNVVVITFLETLYGACQ